MSESDIAAMQAVSDRNRQEVAGFAQQMTLFTLREMYEKAVRDGKVGAGVYGADSTPLVQGMLGGIVEFLIRGGVSDVKINEMITETVAELIPQARMAIDAEAMGATQEGRA